MHRTINSSAHAIDLPSESIHAIITSPPYFNLRAYAGDQAVDWPAVEFAPMPGMSPVTIAAWRGGLGNEPTIDMFIGHLVLCLREWWRVLRNDGVLFCNLGDSYNGSGGAGGDYNAGGIKDGQPKFKGNKVSGLKPKDLCMVPQRFALAAQADGWYIRQEIIWAKGVSFLPDYAGSCMPESVQDRPVRGHEQVWMLTKSPKYFWDQEAVKEGLRYPDADDGSRTYGGANKNGANIQHGDRTTGGTYDNAPSGRSIRSVWVINPGAYPGAHFATFPEKLVEPMVKASTSAYGVCPNCLAPYERVVERSGSNWEQRKAAGHPTRYGQFPKGVEVNTFGHVDATTTGWQPTCTCNAGEPIPATILDPFAGSGTTLRVALRLGRHAIGVDISDVYLKEHVEDRVSGLQFEMAF